LSADYYRKQAARVRELPAGATTPALKEHLRDIACQYDALAEQADEVAPGGATSP
jgi:hypothetical protein